MSKERQRLGARADFDEWAESVVAAVKKHRLRSGGSPRALDEPDQTGLRRWVSRVITKIAA